MKLLNYIFIFVLYITFAFLFLPAFGFVLFGSVYQYLYIMIYISLFILFIVERKNIVQKLNDFFTKTPLKILIIFFIASTINSLILSFCGISSYSTTFKRVIMHYIMSILPVIILMGGTINKYISIKKFLRFFILLFWIMLILGFVSFFSRLFNIGVINKIFEFFSNTKILLYQTEGLTGRACDFVEHGLPRLNNLHTEPSSYSCFIFLFLPLIYSFGLGKYAISKNTVINYLVKKTLIPFTWINLIMTMSPIYLIFCVITTVIYFRKKIYYYAKNYMFFFIAIFTITLLILYKLDFSETYISRIINIFTETKSFEDFVILEPSLATRITSFINMFFIFLSNPLFGVGIGNLSDYMLKQFLNSPVPLTLENLNFIKKTLALGVALRYNYSVFYGFLAENGIFVCLILGLYNFSVFKCINKALKTLKQSNNLYHYRILYALKYSFFEILVLYFYTIPFINIYLWVIYSLIMIYIYSTRKIIEKER